jgi:ribonuclease Y
VPYVVGIAIGLLAGFAGAWAAVSFATDSRLATARRTRAALLDDARREAATLRREAELEAKEEAVRLRQEAETELAEERAAAREREESRASPTARCTPRASRRT